MNIKSVGTVVLLAFVAASVGYLIVSEARVQPDESNASTSPTPASTSPAAQSATSSENGVNPVAAEPETPAAPTHQVIAYYFHSTQRCVTCLKIEKLAEAALRDEFATAFENGEFEWHAIDMEDAPNTHFAEEYQLVTSSLVLVDFRDGQQDKWINLEKVWDYVDDELQFEAYVTGNAREYLESPL